MVVMVQLVNGACSSGGLVVGGYGYCSTSCYMGGGLLFLAAVGAVWSWRPASTWTVEVPPQCRHSGPPCPGLSCTPAMTPQGWLAAPTRETHRQGER